MVATKIERAVIEHVARSNMCRSSELAKLIEAKHPGAIERAKARHLDEVDDRRFAGKVPAWAKRLVRKYEEYPRAVTLLIRHSKIKPYSSGRCTYGNDRIVITFGGRDEAEHRYVVLHELAHHLVGYRGEHHGTAFYDRLYQLVKAEGLYRWCIAGGSAHTGAQGLRAAARRARARAA